MKQFLLCNPWIHDFTAYDLWMRPLGLLSLGETLMKSGARVELVDVLDRGHPAWGPNANPKSKADGSGAFFKTHIQKPEIVRFVPRWFSRYGAPFENVEKHLKRLAQENSFDALLLGSSMTYWYLGAAETARLLRRCFPGTPLIFGGLYADLLPGHAAQHINADLICSFHERPPPRIRELEKILGTKLQPWSESLPQSIGRAMSLYPHPTSYPLMTSMGCSFKCKFCATPLLHPGFHRRDFKEVAEEILTAHEVQGMKDFVFYDDALLHQPDKHIKPLLQLLLEAGGGTRFEISFHTPNGLSPRFIDEELASMMKRTGFKRPRLSLESSAPARENDMNAKITLEQYERAMSCLLKSGFAHGEPITYVLAGLPGQKEDEIEATIRAAYEAGSTVTVSGLSPIPGTPSWTDWKIPEHTDPLLLGNSVFLEHGAPRLNPVEVSESTAAGDGLHRLRMYARKLNSIFKSGF